MLRPKHLPADAACLGMQGEADAVRLAVAHHVLVDEVQSVR
jgi:hypothetical protein